MKNTALEIIRSLIETDQEFTYTPGFAAAIIVTKLHTFQLHSSGRFIQKNNESPHEVTTDEADFTCGDAPAPCNCDNIIAHSGH